MNNTITNHTQASNFAIATHTAKTILLASTLAFTTTPVFALDNYTQNALFTPGSGLLKAEARGRIMIYDGLQIATVEKVMDEQFDRIDNMMFVRIQHPLANGDVLTEEDDC